MSEYQYYKFERLDGYLDAKARQALRAISSRAEISATSFQVYYTYSDLKAEPFELMLKYFDIGFYYADWGSIVAYIKLPAGTLPEDLLGFSSDGLHVHENDECSFHTTPLDVSTCNAGRTLASTLGNDDETGGVICCTTLSPSARETGAIQQCTLSYNST